jgi:hypothetical protein
VPDIFTQTEDAIGFALRSYAPLTNLVKPGNIITYTSDANPNPEKENPQSADLPELMVYPAGMLVTGTPGDSGLVDQTYLIVARTGETRTSKGLNQLKALIYNAMARYLRGDKPMGLMHIYKLQLMSADEQRRQGAENPPPSGWDVVVGILASFKISHAEAIA